MYTATEEKIYQILLTWLLSLVELLHQRYVLRRPEHLESIPMQQLGDLLVYLL